VRRSQRAREIADRLAGAYPDVTCELDFADPWQLLVATVLSAQCTDAQVNRLTPELFRRWPGPEALAAAPIEDIEEVIRPAGCFRTKAKALKESARLLLADHAGVVPRQLEELVQLPGVGRKTAKVVLGEAYGIAAGIAVDTHVKRLAGRFGLSANSDPERVASDLEGLIPRGEWVQFSQRVIHHGRRVCSARRPDCDRCVLLGVCAQRGIKTPS